MAITFTATPAKVVLDRPSYGISPAGFPRIHVELHPKEVAKLVGYDPRSLVLKPPRMRIDEEGKVHRKRRDSLPHNVSPQIVHMQNQVQRSIDNTRVTAMVEYLRNAIERGTFADWGPIEVVTTSRPDTSEYLTNHKISMDSDADYFIADGQHRYCAILDFVRENSEYADRFTQSVTISVLPADKLSIWAGQAFHDRNYFAVAVRAGKALSVDYRDPLNALAKDLATHPEIVKAGGIAYERDTLLKNDSRLTTHSVFHRFVRGFLYGRPGLEKGATGEFEDEDVANLRQYITLLGECLPWEVTPDREQYLTRTSVVITALAVIGHDLYFNGLAKLDIEDKIRTLCEIDWRRTNLNWVGVIGTEKGGVVQPSSARPTIDATIRYLREILNIAK